MPKLKELINGQDLKFDTHQAGDGAEVNWQSLHMDKSMHGKKGKARFDLFGESDPVNNGMKPNDFDRVISEVRKVLGKNQDTVEKFASEIVSQIERFKNGNANVDDVSQAAKNIARYFDLKPDFLRVVTEYAIGKLVSFASIHYDEESKKLFEIVVDDKSVYIQRPQRRNSLARIVKNNCL